MDAGVHTTGVMFTGTRIPLKACLRIGEGNLNTEEGVFN